MSWFIKYINRLEKRYWANLSKKSFYKLTKLILLLPIVLVYNLYKFTTKYIRLKRNNKPAIKLQNIINGWYNLAISNAVVERIAMERANICAKCPFAEMSNGVYNVVIDSKTTQVRGLKCTKCGCPLSAKIRSSQDYCPIGKW